MHPLVEGTRDEDGLGGTLLPDKEDRHRNDRLRSLQRAIKKNHSTGMCHIDETRPASFPLCRPVHPGAVRRQAA